MRRAPLLLTMDLEVARDHDLGDQHRALEDAWSDLGRLALPATVFATAEACAEFRAEVAALRDSGHEIACHGFAHGPDENYRLLPPPRARAELERATRAIEERTGVRPRSFRGPFMSTSPATQEALVGLGYGCDCSVCPGRLDIRNGRGGHPGWLTAPRRPYRPSADSPYRRGDRPLWVIPLSGLGLPFQSGTLFLLGLPLTALLYRVLAAEARRFGSPLVYLFHSYEFARRGAGAGPAGGTPFVQRLYARDRGGRLRRHRELLARMARDRRWVPQTASQWVAAREGQPRP